MKLFAFTRAIRSGIIHFWRNIWLSLAATGIMVLTLSMVAALIVLTVLGQKVLIGLESKVDVTVFMADSSTEAQVMAVKTDIAGRKDVAEVDYISKDQALASFKDRYKDNSLISQALEEVGNNPMQAALVIKAVTPESYAGINEALKSPKYEQFIARVTYDDNRQVIDRLNSIIKTTRQVGTGITIALAIIAILVTFNTIRLAIYGYHREIEIMTLVGASPWFIKGPFVIEGILAGTISSVVTLLFLYPILAIVSPRVSSFFMDDQFSLYSWSIQNALTVVGLIIGAGIILGAVSSVIAVQRYLNTKN